MMLFLLFLVAASDPPVVKGFVPPAAQVANASRVRFVVVSTSWCVPCQRLKAMTLPDVRKRYDVEIVDGDRDTSWRVGSYPTVIVLADGKEVSRSSGFMSADAMFSMADRAKASLPVAKSTSQVVRVHDPDSHTHVCPSCLYEWSHTHDSYGSKAAHTCPNCSELLPAPWKVASKETRLARVTETKPKPRDVLPYDELHRRVEAGDDVTVCVGFSDGVHLRCDVPSTDPGVWRCWKRNGSPYMERIGAMP